MSSRSLLTEEAQIDLVTMIAKHFTPAHAAREMYSKYEVKISAALYCNYASSPKWIPVIKKIRDKYQLHFNEAPLASKRVRLERAELAYRRAEARGDDNLVMDTLEHGRKETDTKTSGEASPINITLQQINLMTDEEIENRKQELLARLLKPKEIKEVKNGSSGTSS